MFRPASSWSSTRRAPGARRRLLALALLLAAGGCSATDAGGPTAVGVVAGGGRGVGGSGGGGSPSGTARSLVGSWFRLVFLPDSLGGVQTSETTLTFNADGTLLRTVVFRDLASGFADGVASAGTWSASATQVRITVSPTGVPIDGSPSTDGLAPSPPNPPFGSDPTAGGMIQAGTPGDSLGAPGGTVVFDYRIETADGATTLFLGTDSYVRLTDARLTDVRLTEARVSTP